MSLSWAEKMRRELSAKRITAILVFGAIVLVFVFFGLPNRLGAGGVGSVARVNQTLISIADFQNEEQRIQRIQEYYSQLFGQQIPPGPERQKEYKQQAIKSLVHMELLSQAADAHGLAVTDAEVVDLIRQTPEFQKDGLFQSELYFGLLKANRLTPADYEAKMRKQAEQNKIQSFFEISAYPTKHEVQKMLEFKKIKLNVAFVKLSADEIGKNMQVSGAQLSETLKKPDFMQKVEADFKNNQAEYVRNQKIRAQHILVTFKAGDQVSEKKAFEKIKEIKARTANEDFGSLAQKLSEDPGSKTKKGDLGFFARGKMVPEFENIAFSSQVGVVSEPVKTQYGYHLIKVTEKPGVELKDFQNDIAKKILAQEFLDKNTKNIEQALAQQDLAKIESEFKATGLKWEETGDFDLSADFIPKLPGESLSKAVFELSPQHKLSKELVRSGADRYVLMLKELKNEKAEATTATASPESTSVAKQRAFSWMNSWIEEFQKKSNVEINQNVLSL